MAKKLQTPEEKPGFKTGKILDILRTEYPFERILLGVLGGIVLIMGVYLVEGSLLQIKLTSWWIFNSDIKRTIFSIIVIVVGAISLIMAVFPFFIPSIAEMKKVTWPDRKTILNHSARVFGFIIAISLFYVLVDWPLRRIFEWITTLGQ